MRTWVPPTSAAMKGAMRDWIDAVTRAPVGRHGWRGRLSRAPTGRAESWVIVTTMSTLPPDYPGALAVGRAGTRHESRHSLVFSKKQPVHASPRDVAGQHHGCAGRRAGRLTSGQVSRKECDNVVPTWLAPVAPPGAARERHPAAGEGSTRCPRPPPRKRVPASPPRSPSSAG